MKVLVFGQLTDIIGANSLELNSPPNSELLIAQLKEQFPLLKSQVFLVAVNNKVIKECTDLNDQTVVALMPPYSGG